MQAESLFYILSMATFILGRTTCVAVTKKKFADGALDHLCISRTLFLPKDLLTNCMVSFHEISTC